MSCGSSRIVANFAADRKPEIDTTGLTLDTRG
jgi:hypothetical protein